MSIQNKIKTPQEVEAMREGGIMLATVLEVLKQKISPGQSTKFLANIANDTLKKLGGKPAFLGYSGFPDVLCISVNEEIVHGIPRTDKIIRDGDIVGLDFGVLHKGLITDSAITVIVGNPLKKIDEELVKNTEKSLMAGISMVKNGMRIGTISSEIQKVLQKSDLGIVTDLVGHGVGHNLHEDPNIPNYGIPETGPILKAGMTIAIEPMATLGGGEVYVDNDGWTVKSRDSSRSAHFEHTILVTQQGYEILTIL